MTKQELMEKAKNELSVLELYQILGEKEGVFALKIWQRADLEEILKDSQIRLSEDQIYEVMQESRDQLEDCSGDAETIHAAVKKIKNRK